MKHTSISNAKVGLTAKYNRPPSAGVKEMNEQSRTAGHSTEALVITGLVGVIFGIWIGASLVKNS